MAMVCTLSISVHSTTFLEMHCCDNVFPLANDQITITEDCK
jgi:hypothetical protein